MKKFENNTDLESYLSESGNSAPVNEVIASPNKAEYNFPIAGVTKKFHNIRKSDFDNAFSTTGTLIDFSDFELADLLKDDPGASDTFNDKTIPANLFIDSGWSNLETINIPDEIETIEDGAFSNCKKLTRVVIGRGLKNMTAKAFEGCPLVELIIRSDSWNWRNNKFLGFPYLSYVRVHGHRLNSEELLAFTGGGGYYGGGDIIKIEIDGIEYEITKSKGTASVTGLLPGSGDITIPFSIRYEDYNYSVVSIGEEACVIHPGIIITSPVYIPNSVVLIGNEAFGGQSLLPSVNIPNSVTSIGNHAFDDCNLMTSVTIPESVTSIGDYAFNNCTSLALVIVLATTPPRIGTDVFSDNASGRKIYVPAESVNAYKAAAGWDTYAYYILGISLNIVAKYNVTNTTITTSLINSTSNLYGMHIDSAGDQVLKQTDCQFTTVGEHTVVYLLSGNGNDGNSISTEQFKQKSALTSVIIGTSITSIVSGAFYGCTGLTSITIPNSVTSIGGAAFEGCTGLTSITIPESVTEISYTAFSNCSSLTSITVLATTPPTLNGGAFSNNASGRKIYVPAESVNAYKAASGWSDYANDIEAKLPVTAIFSVTNTKEQTRILNDNGSYVYVSGMKIDGILLQAVSNWCQFSGTGRHVVEYLLLGTSLGGFSECSNLTSITIPSSVTSIGNYAFDACSGLTSITIPSSVTSIGHRAFEYCSNLTSVTISNSVTSIGSFAFLFCYNMTSVTIPNGVTSINDSTFSGCYGLTSVTIPESVTSIGDDAFSNCTHLTSITVLATTPPTLWYDAFNDHVSGRKIYVPAASLNAYKTASVWSNFAADIVAIQ